MVRRNDPELNTLAAGFSMRQNQQCDEFGISHLTQRQIEFNARCAGIDLLLHKSMKSLNAARLYEVARKTSHLQGSPDSRNFGPRRPRPVAGMCEPHRYTPLGPAPPWRDATLKVLDAL